MIRSKKQRKEWIVKPVYNWGANGFHQGGDFGRDQWNQMILGLPDKSASQGMLLQRKVNSALYERSGLAPNGELLKLDKLRTRVSPFYLFWQGTSKLVGVVITLRRSIKVHGATDSIIAICYPETNGRG